MLPGSGARGGECVNSHQGHRARKKRQFRDFGLDAFADHEALELLLFYAIPRQDTNPLAHELLNRFGSLSAVMDASVEELMTVDGIGERAAVLLKLVPALARSYTLDHLGKVRTFQSGEELKEYLLALYTGCTKERVYLLLFDNRDTLLRTVQIGEGDLTAALFSTREIVQQVLLYSKTTKVILSHNHPVGLALPSHADQTATDEIQRALSSVEVTLYDHIIVSGNRECYSLRERRIFP